MTAQAGDRILVESERAGQPGRSGVVEEVLATSPPRYRVRWDDGHTTTVVPAAGALRIASKRKKARAAAKR